MPFELSEVTTGKLHDVVVLSQKNRQPDEDPGAKLTIEVPLPNSSLAMFDGGLKGALFMSGAKKAQQPLDGVDAVSDAPNLTSLGQHVGVVRWSGEWTGYTLTIDLGMGGKSSNLDIADCTISAFRITPKEGGTVLVKLNVESGNVSEKAFGRLAKLKSREVHVLLTPPEARGADLVDDAQAPAAKSAAAPAAAPADAPAEPKRRGRARLASVE